MNAPELRLANIDSWQTLLELGRQTFTESFAAYNTPENLNYYLNKAFNQQVLMQELADPQSQYYICYQHTQPIGYMKLNLDRTPDALKPAQALEIQRIYVLKAFQGQKMGSLLMRKAIDMAKVRGMSYVWLGVWEHNQHAIAYYQRWGFEKFGSYIFPLGDDLQTDYLMKLKIA